METRRLGETALRLPTPASSRAPGSGRTYSSVPCPSFVHQLLARQWLAGARRETALSSNIVRSLTLTHLGYGLRHSVIRPDCTAIATPINRGRVVFKMVRSQVRRSPGGRKHKWPQETEIRP